MPRDHDKSHGSRAALFSVLLIIAIISALWLSSCFLFDVTSR
jgi:hypothetical protein